MLKKNYFFSVSGTCRVIMQSEINFIYVQCKWPWWRPLMHCTFSLPPSLGVSTSLLSWGALDPPVSSQGHAPHSSLDVYGIHFAVHDICLLALSHSMSAASESSHRNLHFYSLLVSWTPYPFGLIISQTLNLYPLSLCLSVPHTHTHIYTLTHKIQLVNRWI